MILFKKIVVFHQAIEHVFGFIIFYVRGVPPGTLYLSAGSPSRCIAFELLELSSTVPATHTAASLVVPQYNRPRYIERSSTTELADSREGFRISF